MFNDILEHMGRELMTAIASDLSDPATQAQLRRNIDATASRVLGIDVRSTMIRPFWDRIVDQASNEMKAQAVDFAGLAISDPPQSVDAAAEVVREAVNEKVNSMADLLKKKLETRQQAKQ